MPEKKPVVGHSWQPQLPIPSLSKAANDSSDTKSQIEVSSRTLWKPNSELVDGRSWFDMPAQTMTPELQKELKLLKLRDAIDPKRHYKKGDSKSKALAKYFQVGTVIESPLEFFSGRLTKKERKASLADELLSDPSLAAYRKRKVREIEEKNRPGGNENWKIKGQSSRRRAKERIFTHKGVNP